MSRSDGRAAEKPFSWTAAGSRPKDKKHQVHKEPKQLAGRTTARATTCTWQPAAMRLGEKRQSALRPHSESQGDWPAGG